MKFTHTKASWIHSSLNKNGCFSKTNLRIIFTVINLDIYIQILKRKNQIIISSTNFNLKVRGCAKRDLEY